MLDLLLKYRMFSDLAQLAQLPLLLLLLTRNNRPGRLIPYTCKVYIYMYSRIKYMCSINNRPARLTDGADDPGGLRDYTYILYMYYVHIL